MQLKLIGEKKAIVAAISGELDHHVAQNIREAMDKELKRTNAINVIFDFKDLAFMDSSGIGVIIGRYKTVKILGGDVVVVSPNAQVKKILDMAGISKIVKIASSMNNALIMIDNK